MSETKLINLTPNTIVVFDEAGERVRFRLPPASPPAYARAVVNVIDEGKEMGSGEPFKVVVHEFEDPVNVPEPRDGVTYVVGYAVLQALRNRPDCVAPDTSQRSAVRDDDGRIVGVKRFRV